MLQAVRFSLRALTILAVAGTTGIAHADPDVPAVIVDADSGEVLHAEEATRPWFPASTTKLMTAYVALREVERGNIAFDTPIVATATATRQPPSKIGIKAGQEITLGNALKILMVKSANDVATVIAEGVGGSVPGFSAMMNREAARLGMRESHFVNPHGLHSDNHVSSARDMAILARALLREFPQYRGLWGIGAVQLGNRKYPNTNGLIGRYSGAMGMKTGFVCASGFNLVSAAERGGRTLIAVVFGATSGADRTLKAAQLLDQGFGAGGGFFGRGASSGARTLEALTASYETSAPNRRAAICGRGRAPASEEDAGGSLTLASGMSDTSDNIMNPGRGFYSGGEAAGVGARVGRRISLGPRAPLEALEVHLGREPGSTAVARRATGAPEPQAFANEPKRGKSNPLALTEPMKRPTQAARIGTAKQGADRPAATASLHAANKNKLPKMAVTQTGAPQKAKAEGAKAKAKADPKPKIDSKAKAQPKAKSGT
ncbi:MAG: D-alanyl-D-alanine carboxypeptidase [Proteobacteria bacterium]|nr:D-alanyl-D-alanine carboxypeptidase [Pseudomonadota bacterium]